MLEEKNMAITVNGGQANFAKDYAKIYATQNNGASANELDNIIKGIMKNLSDLNQEDEENITDIVEMVKDELTKPEPKVGRLRNCVTLIAPMITIANGFPVLANNLQRLIDYIMPYIG